MKINDRFLLRCRPDPIGHFSLVDPPEPPKKNPFATSVSYFRVIESAEPKQGGDEYEVQVKAVGLPEDAPWYTRFAYHAFIDVKLGSEGDWQRVEIYNEKAHHVAISPEDARADIRFGEKVYRLKTYRGSEAVDMAREIIEKTEEYIKSDYTYIPLPGPNSNTFIDYLGRNVSGLDFELPHNAVGETFAFPLRAGITASGDGIEFQTPIFGFRLGITNGIEIQLFGLTFGISFFPPGIKIPFLPRIGFGDVP